MLSLSRRLQDYVKWRGQLFHQFLRALVDDSAEVRAMAEFLLIDTLCSKVCPILLSHPLPLITGACPAQAAHPMHPGDLVPHLPKADIAAVCFSSAVLFAFCEVAQVRLTDTVVVSTCIPGEGHNLKSGSVVMIPWRPG